MTSQQETLKKLWRFQRRSMVGNSAGSCGREVLGLKTLKADLCRFKDTDYNEFVNEPHEEELDIIELLAADF